VSRASVKQLICKGLGYCCLYAFFSIYKRTGVIAARLGASERAIRYRRAAFKRGEMKCEKCKGCLRDKGVVK
jgi:hypothetical protein